MAWLEERQASMTGDVARIVATTIAYAFSLPGAWTAIATDSIDLVADTGELTLPYNLLRLPYSELEVTYTAGCIAVPEAVKITCAQLLKNAQATPQPPPADAPSLLQSLRSSCSRPSSPPSA